MYHLPAQKIGLVLSGGGARAAYQVGVLKAISELIDTPCCNPFPIICGTSAGGLNAAGIASRADCLSDAVAELVTFGQTLKRLMFTEPTGLVFWVVP